MAQPDDIDSTSAGTAQSTRSCTSFMSLRLVATHLPKKYLARKITENKSKREARRCHKRQLANVIIRHMWNDAERHTPTTTTDRLAAA